MKKLILPETGLTRRRFLSMSAGAALALVAGPVLASPTLALPAQGERRLSFLNTHTGESLKATYWQEGQYVPEELDAINHVLRDFRVNAAGNMSPQLMDLLYDLQQNLGTNQPFHVISGYRSPKTNAMLHTRSSGVAKNSRHMLGQAIDIRVPGVDLKHLYKTALNMRAGGVGYYSKSDFVHVDVGPYRTWGA